MIERREFLQSLGGGLLVVLAADAQRTPTVVSGWLHIAGDGAITAFAGKAEMGQNVRTSLAQAVAEELRAPAAAVRMVVGDTDLTPYDAGTFGSRTTPYTAPELRKAAAEARHMLAELAARKWNVEPADITFENAQASTKDGRSCGYGELTHGQKIERSIRPDIALRPATEWTVLGTSAEKVGGREIVTGRHKYPSDIRRPGMLYGKVLRPPAFGAELVSASGPQLIRDGDFAGVVAPTPEAAEEALAAVRAEWKTSPQPSASEIFDWLRRHAESRPERVKRKFEATYTMAYIAHAPLEPRAAVAEWAEGKLTVWTGTQRPFGVREELMHAFGLPEARVRVIVPDPGSGYGGKHTGDAAIEAARLSKAAGKPVQVVWTREEEFTWAYFRPAGVIDVGCDFSPDGRMTAWDFHNYNSGEAGIRHVYDIREQNIRFHRVRSPLRQGSYRALAATANHFARETAIDELAALARLDPLEFRLRNLKDARMRAVLTAAAERFGWGTRPAPGQGFGIACGFEKQSYVATCAEVSVQGKTVRVRRLVTAFDCGAVVNPDHLRNQIEGCAVMGLGGALFEAIQFENGKILNPRFSRYRVPRFTDVPKIDIVLLDRKDIASAGAGETPIVGIAPSIGGAIYQAAGKRLRAMPLRL